MEEFTIPVNIVATDDVTTDAWSHSMASEITTIHNDVTSLNDASAIRSDDVSQHAVVTSSSEGLSTTHLDVLSDLDAVLDDEESNNIQLTANKNMTSQPGQVGWHTSRMEPEGAPSDHVNIDKIKVQRSQSIVEEDEQSMEDYEDIEAEISVNLDDNSSIIDIKNNNQTDNVKNSSSQPLQQAVNQNYASGTTVVYITSNSCYSVDVANNQLDNSSDDDQQIVLPLPKRKSISSVQSESDSQTAVNAITQSEENVIKLFDAQLTSSDDDADDHTESNSTIQQLSTDFQLELNDTRSIDSMRLDSSLDQNSAHRQFADVINRSDDVSQVGSDNSLPQLTVSYDDVVEDVVEQTGDNNNCDNDFRYTVPAPKRLNSAHYDQHETEGDVAHSDVTLGDDNISFSTTTKVPTDTQLETVRTDINSADEDVKLDVNSLEFPLPKRLSVEHVYNSNPPSPSNGIRDNRRAARVVTSDV